MRFQAFRYHVPRLTRQCITTGHRRDPGTPIHCERKPQASGGRRGIGNSGSEAYSLYIRHFGLDPGDIEKLGGGGGRLVVVGTEGHGGNGQHWRRMYLYCRGLGAKMRQYWRYCTRTTKAVAAFAEGDDKRPVDLAMTDDTPGGR